MPGALVWRLAVAGLMPTSAAGAIELPEAARGDAFLLHYTDQVVRDAWGRHLREQPGDDTVVGASGETQAGTDAGAAHVWLCGLTGAEPCAPPAQCVSGLCVGGYRCGAGRDSSCETRDVPGGEGICTLLAEGEAGSPRVRHRLLHRRRVLRG